MILTRLRNRKARHPKDPPYAQVTLDADTVESLLYALDELAAGELDVRTAAFRNSPLVQRLLDSSATIRRFLGGALASAREEEVERSRPTQPNQV